MHDMKSLNLDLAQKPEVATNTPYNESGAYYPTLHLTDVPEDIEIPESGKLMVEFKRLEKVEVNRDGKERCSYTLEICKIVSCDCEGGEAKQSPSRNTENVLDALLKEYQAGKQEE